MYPCNYLTVNENKEKLCSPDGCDDLFDIHLSDLGPFLLDLGHRDDKNAVFHLGSDSKAINLIALIRAGRGERHVTLKHAHLPLTGGQGAEELLVTRAVDYTSNVQDAAVGVPVDTNVLLLGSREGDVEDEGSLGVEDVDGGSEGVVGFVTIARLRLLEALGMLTDVLEQRVVGPAAHVATEIEGETLA